MGDIRTGFPGLARHEGVWEGVYTHVDTDNNIVDQHKSRLQCTFPEDGEYDYYQINTYVHPDGSEEEIHFPAKYADGRIYWDTDRIKGYAWQADDRTTMLYWERKDIPGNYMYEMIQISDDNNNRGRTWHWFDNDVLVKRTCIKEKRVS